MQVEQQSEELNKLPRIARIITLPLVAVALIHTLFIATWVAPSNPVQDRLGADTVREYALPLFEQNWSIFAPNPRRVAVTFEVRALVEDSETGDQESTDWIDLVDYEDAEVHLNPFPSRTSGMGRRTADRLHSAVSDMNSEQRELIEAAYTETPVEQLRGVLNSVSGGATSGDVNRYMAADQLATNLATYVAHHALDGELVAIQYRTSTRPAPSFANRDEGELDEANRNVREYGWRAPAEVDENSVEYFSNYLDRAGMSR